MRNTDDDVRIPEKLTTKHSTCHIPYHFFVKSRFPVIVLIFQTRQTIGRYGVGIPLAGLTITLEFQTEFSLGLLCRPTFMTSLTYSMGLLIAI